MCILIFRTALRVGNNSSVALSQVLNHGFWSTKPRQNAKFASGTLQTLSVPRKREGANPNSNRYSNVFLTVRGSSTTNLCHQGKLSIKLFIGKSLNDWGKGWHVCDQALHALGCWPTTTPHFTLLYNDNAPCHTAVFINECLAEKSIPVVPQSTLFAGSYSLWFRLFPRLKNH